MFNSEENVEVAYHYPPSKERAKTGKELGERSASIFSVRTHPLGPFSSRKEKKRKKEKKGIIHRHRTKKERKKEKEKK